jgi:hypothetical protein
VTDQLADKPAESGTLTCFSSLGSNVSKALKDMYPGNAMPTMALHPCEAHSVTSQAMMVMARLCLSMTHTSYL